MVSQFRIISLLSPHFLPSLSKDVRPRCRSDETSKDNWIDMENVNVIKENRRTSNNVYRTDPVNDLKPITPGVYYPPNRGHRHKYIKPKTKRIVCKNGEFNICKWKRANSQCRFSTWFITLVEARWRWTLLNFFVAFTSDWLLFGFIHWAIALTHGDLSDDHLPHNQNDSQWTPCVKNIYGFTSTFLFSVEVHTTVAYGRRAITIECPQTIFTMCLQCIVSSIFQALMVGILFAKLTRPKSRTQTILFSKHLTVTLRNDKLCLLFRVGDVRVSRILNIQPSMFVMRRALHEDMLEDFDQLELKVDLDGCESTFFLWPISVVHVIDENSPLYDISAADLLGTRIEIIAVFEGLIESTGQPMQARTSYTSRDILWGHRFVPIVFDDHSDSHYIVDYSKLSDTIQIDTPLCSAMEYESITASVSENNEKYDKDISD